MDLFIVNIFEARGQAQVLSYIKHIYGIEVRIEHFQHVFTIASQEV